MAIVNICIHNPDYDIEGGVFYTDSFHQHTDTEKYPQHLDIEITVDDEGYQEHEVCWFEQKGVHLSFHCWNGNQELLEREDLTYFPDKYDKMFYIRVCDYQTLPNQASLENKLTSAVKKYQRIWKKIH